MYISNALRRTALTVFVILVGISTSAYAQTPARPAPAGVRPAAGIGSIVGKLADSTSGHPVGSGSVAVRRTGETAFLSGALPQADGSFRIEGLAPGKYTVRVRVIGFAPYIKNDVEISAAKPAVDLGTIPLTIVATKLDAQETVAEREDVVIQPDRTSYSVKNMPAASGGTAVDVLRSIPAVEVDGSNNVSLRGNSNVVIQINGRPTPLKGDQLGAFLAQLPAGTVKNVEVATNPSAKDDPEGTAGIINIVLNAEAEVGLSGGINASTSSTGMVNGGGNIGKQMGKFIAYGSANFYRDNRNTSGTISRTNLVLPVPAFTETSLGGHQSPISGGGNFRTEYRFTPQNSLNFDGYFGLGRFGGNSNSDYTDLDPSHNVIASYNQFTNQISRNLYQDWDLTYRNVGEKNAPRFSTELEYFNANNTNNTDLSGDVFSTDATSPAVIRTEHDHTVGSQPNLNWKADFTHQFGTFLKLETGTKLTRRENSNKFDASYFDPSTKTYTLDPIRATDFKYTEDIGGAYVLASNQINKFQTQLGLRLEEAATYMDVNTANIRTDHRYNSAYPSAIVSYKFTDLRTLKLSYSRRVSRPNPYQLSPVEFRQDTRNVFRGNPNLNAEYTDALESTYSEARSWGTIQINPYYRQTNHAVRNIQFIDSTGVSVSTFENVAKTKTYGTDMNLNSHFGPFLVGGGGSLYHYKSDASNLAGNLSANATVWALRTNATWRFGKNGSLGDAQLFANYRAPYATEGGSQIAQVFMQMGARWKAWGDKGNIGLRVSDPFALQKFGYKTANGTVVEYSERFFGTRAVFLTFTRNFGQALKLQPKSDPDPSGGQPGVGGPP